MCQDHSHNKVMEGQINSFRAQPLAGSSRDMHRGTWQGPSFTAWFWCWGIAVEHKWEHGGKALGIGTGNHRSLSPSTVEKLGPKVPG